MEQLSTFLNTKKLRVALVHDWLVTYRGGERVLEALLDLFPEAPIYTLFYEPHGLPPKINERKIYFPRKLQHLIRFRKQLLPFYPAIIESFHLESYDLVISSSSCVAKGVIPHPGSKHLCYLHSPMRYIWDQREHYQHSFQSIPGLASLFTLVSSYLRTWDTVSSHRVDKFVVNSSFVQDRVTRFYRRSSEVVPPPVNLHQFFPLKEKKKGGYFLVAGSFVPYKRFDLAITACAQAKRKLVVAGFGPEEKKLRQLADKKTTSFVIRPEKEQWLELLQHADALIFPGIEDFGIVPIEAIACGTPVIAFKKGGALDYVEQGKNGSFFNHPTVPNLIELIENFDPKGYDQRKLRETVTKFDVRHFKDAITKKILELLKEF